MTVRQAVGHQHQGTSMGSTSPGRDSTIPASCVRAMPGNKGSTLWDNTSHNVQIAAGPYTQNIPDFGYDVKAQVWDDLSIGLGSNLDVVTGVVPQRNHSFAYNRAWYGSW